MARRRQRVRRRRQRNTETLIPRSGVVDAIDAGPKAPTQGPLAGVNSGPPPPPMPTATYDSIYNNDMAAGQAAYDTTIAGIGLQRSRLGYDTGFGADGQVDLSNAYSQAMMLQREAQQANRGITTSSASRGQLYSGSRQVRADEANFQYERSRSNLQTAAKRGYEDLTLAERQAGNDLNLTKYDAAAEQAQRWRDQQKDWYELYG